MDDQGPEDRRGRDRVRRDADRLPDRLWIGYRIKPVYRAFGFASCAYMTLGLLIAAPYLAIT